MKHYQILHAWVVLCLFAPVMLKADIDTAQAFYENEDYQSAFIEFSTLAYEGNIVAQYNLAFMFYGGDGIAQDYEQAFYWFNSAAMAGHPMAQDLLAHMYYHGYGTKKDNMRAYIWYSLAADNGLFFSSMVRDSIEDDLGKSEKAQAELMIRQYLKEIKATTTK